MVSKNINMVSFLVVGARFMKHGEVFEEHFLADFADLQRDRTVNVRLKLAFICGEYARLFRGSKQARTTS